MQKFIFLLVLSAVLGCQKSEVETLQEDIDKTSVKVLYSAEFTGTSYSTTGTISVVEDQDGIKKLLLENFRTDSGPDLRLYLAENKQARNSIEIVASPKNGTYTLDLPGHVDFEQHRFALIWCKRFSQLFGSAEIKK